jgi:OTT_1508-like deaminase
LIKSQQFDPIHEKADRNEDLGNNRNPFTNMRHFIGRLGSHVQHVKVLMKGARRFPGLVEDWNVHVVNGPSLLILPPPPRKKLTIPGIVNRMISCDEELTRDITSRLQSLNNGTLKIEQRILKEYGEKKLKPRVHAELVLLEYFYQQRDELQFYDNDRYIAASKPACYCCSLYIQMIYLNWLPPTSSQEIRDANPTAAIHEQNMLNNMVKAIRARVKDQIKDKTGGDRRRPHFDSVTWETLQNRSSTARHGGESMLNLSQIDTMSRLSRHGSPDVDQQDAESGKIQEDIDEELSASFDGLVDLKEESDDSDNDGGVKLQAR